MLTPTKRLRRSGAVLFLSYFAAVALILIGAAFWACLR